MSAARCSRMPTRNVRRGYFKLGLFCFGMWVVVAAYLVIWVKYVLKVEEEWEDYSPRAIPFATLCGLVGIIRCARLRAAGPCARTSRAASSPARRAARPTARSFIISFWPVWGFLTLPIVFVFFMGMLHLAHFVPL